MTKHKIPLTHQLASFPLPFWIAIIMEMIERLAYYGVRVVIPIYIAQADEINALHFTQIQKGQIFLWWAIVQSLVPMFSGGFADRYGYKNTIAFSIVLKIFGYLLMATQTAFLPFLLSCCLLGFGTAIFKPGVQGTLVKSITNETSSVGWGTFYMLVNLGGFLGPPIAHFLYGYSWQMIFYGCAIIVSLNFFLLFTYKEVESGTSRDGTPWKIIKMTIKNICEPKLAIFIVIMSGFWLMFMQLFDLLPNFIVDWVDSSKLAQHLPSWMTHVTPRGVMIAQEWMINTNAGWIFVFVVLISWLVSRMRRLNSIFLGIIIASLGLVVAGWTMSAFVCLLGIFVFSFGEMLASPKMNDYLGVIAPVHQKALFMGYANIPLAIGWGYGSLMGGEIYNRMGDKANLALRYMFEKFGLTAGMTQEAVAAKLQAVGISTAPIIDAFAGAEGVARTNATALMGIITGMDPSQVTITLWNLYKPYELWYQFAAIGIASAIGIAIYGQLAKRWESKNI